MCKMVIRHKSTLLPAEIWSINNPRCNDAQQIKHIYSTILFFNHSENPRMPETALFDFDKTHFLYFFIKDDKTAPFNQHLI